MPEEEGTRWIGIGKGGEDGTLIRSDSVQQSVVVIMLRGELGKSGVHSVLRGEHDGHKTQFNETIHQRLRILELTTTRVENNGLQLTLVANQNHTLRSVDDWNHGFRLHSLRCLIDQNRIENEITEKTVTRCIASRHDNTGLIDNRFFHATNDFEVVPPFSFLNLCSFLHVHTK